MEKKIISHSNNYLYHEFLLSIFYTMLSIFVSLAVSIFWNITWYHYVLVFICSISCINLIREFFLNKTWYITVEKNKIICSYGTILKIEKVVLLSKVYSFEIKENFLSSKLECYNIALKTLDSEFEIKGIAHSDLQAIVQHIENLS
ncbi:hypothetical protein ACS6ZW_03665 [Streptococcus suis]